MKSTSKLLLIQLTAIYHCLAASDLPTFDFSLFARGQLFEEAKTAAGQIGAFGLSFENHPILDTTLVSSCFASEQFKGEVRTKAIAPGTLRTTSATSKVGSESFGAHPECVRKQTTEVDLQFDEVSVGVFNFLRSLFGKLPTYRVGSQEIELSEAPYLNHLHLYDRLGDQAKNGSFPYSVPYHVDNGLFLLVTTSKSAAPLRVQTKAGDEILASGSSSVIVLFGLGLTDWILSSDEKEEKIHAPLHAVGQIYEQRSVYARMYVAHQDALPTYHKDASSAPPTFESFFRSNQEQHEDPIVDGYKSSHLCSSHHPSSQWMESTKDLCQHGYQWCWMACLELQPNCSPDQQKCYAFGKPEFPCCGEGQSSADGCLDMEPSCEWHC